MESGELWPIATLILAKGPGARMCHSCSYSASGQKLIIYGGEDASNNTILSDLSVLQIKPSKLWIRPAPGSGKNTQPPPLKGHVSASVEGRLYLMGGRSVDNKFNDEVFLLNEATLLWSAPRTTGQKPVPREGASLVTYCAANLKDTHNVDMHDQLLLFGGRSADLTCFNDVHTFSLQRFDKNKWTKRDCAGKIPPPRCYHTTVKVDDEVWLFGGMSNDGAFLNDLYSLNLNTFTWREIDLSQTAELPTPRAHQSMITYTSPNDGTYLLVWGGYNTEGVVADCVVYDLARNSWRVVQETGKKPTGRYGQSLTMIDGSQAYLLAGYPFENQKATDLHIMYPANATLGSAPSSSASFGSGGVTLTRNEMDPAAVARQEEQQRLEAVRRQQEQEEMRRMQERLKQEEERRRREQETKKKHLEAERQKIEEEKLKFEQQRKLQEESLKQQLEDEKRRLEEEKHKMIEVERQKLEAEKLKRETELQVERQQLEAEKLKRQTELEEERKRLDEEKMQREKELEVERQRLEEEKRRREIQLEIERQRLEEERSAALEEVRQLRRQQREENERREAEAKSASLNPSPAQTLRAPRGSVTPPPIPPRASREKGSAPPVPPKNGKVDLEAERVKVLLWKLVDLVNDTKSGQDDKYYSERYHALEDLIKNGTKDLPENGQSHDENSEESMGEKPATRSRNSSEPIEPKALLAPIAEAAVPQQVSPTASPATPAKTVERSLEEQLSRRKYVFDELIETEEHYVNDLKILVRKFMEPLIAQQIITAQDVTLVFSNIQILVGVNEEVLKQLKSMHKLPAAEQQAGTVFLKLADYFKMYTVYCYNQSEAVKRVDQVKRENPKFNKFLDEKVNDPECRSLDLNSFLITPIQRICRYPLLLKELLKYTPKDHVDHAGLSNAIKKVEEVVARLNEERRIIENQIKLAKLDEKIVFEKKQDFDIIDPKRRFVSQGAFDLISSVSDSKSGVVKTKGNSRRIFFLFSDFLLIAKEELDKFMVKQQIPLGTCLVWIIEETGTLEFGSVRSAYF
jgi:hypothetical protein